FQHTAEGVFQVTGVGSRHRVDLVAVNHDQRRVGATQVGIAQLDPATVDQRRRVVADGIFENLRQAAGGPAGDGRLERGLHRLVQMPNAGAMQGGNEVDIGKVDEEQPALQFGLHVVLLALVHAVPLVQGDDQRTAAFQHETEQVEVVVDHPLAGIHDEYHDVGVLDRLQRLDHRELFHRLEDLAATAHAGGVDQGVLLVIALERDVDTVARGTGLVIDDDPLFTEHTVDQRGLADVGTTDDGQLDAVLLARTGNALGLLAFEHLFLFGALFRLAGILGKSTQTHFEHLGNATTVGAGNRQRLAHAHWAELGAGQIDVEVVDLVHHQEALLVTTPQVLA